MERKFLIHKFHESAKRRKYYFKNCKEIIMDRNLKQLKFLCVFLLFFSAVFWLVTPLFYHGWHASAYHYLLTPLLVLTYIFAVKYENYKKKEYNVVQQITIFFLSLVFMETIFIDVFPKYHITASFLPIAFIAIPLLFIQPIRVIYSMISIVEVMFLFMDWMIKSESVWKTDAYFSLVGLVVAYVFFYFVLNLRVEADTTINEFKHRSSIDALTGLMNKISCEQTIRDSLTVQNEMEKCAVLIIDIDNFKKINDTYGHREGDQTLRKMGEVLTRTFRSGDIIGRIGGDEFMVLVRNVPSTDVLFKKCNQIHRDIKSKSTEIEVTCSIGIAFSEDTVFFDEFYEKADQALYQAKLKGKNCHTISYV